MNEVNERFIMTPIALLEVPEFVRYFDSKPIGAVYRVLCARVWRMPKEALRKNSRKRVRILTDLYERGLLASMYDLKELSDAVGYDQRSVRRNLTDLLSLGLIDYEKIDGQPFYIVGETNLKGREKPMLGLGTSNESFYINRWRDFVNFSSKYQPKSLNEFRLELTDFFKNGQKCQRLLTNLSQNLDLDTIRNIVQEAEIQSEDDSLIDNVIDNLNTSSQSSKEDAVPIEEYEFSRIRDLARKDLSESEFFEDALSLSREHVINGLISHKEANSFLAKFVSKDYYQYKNLPRFAVRLEGLSSQTKHKPHTKIVQLWSSLHEDIAGNHIKDSHGEYRKLMSVAKNLLAQYSFEQVIWTFKEISKENGSDLEFASRGIQAFSYIVKKRSKKYHDLKDEELRLKEVLTPNQSRVDTNTEKDYDSYFEDPFGDNYKDTPAQLIKSIGGTDA